MNGGGAPLAALRTTAGATTPWQSVPPETALSRGAFAPGSEPRAVAPLSNLRREPEQFRPTGRTRHPTGDAS